MFIFFIENIEFKRERKERVNATATTSTIITTTMRICTDADMLKTPSLDNPCNNVDKRVIENERKRG